MQSGKIRSIAPDGTVSYAASVLSTTYTVYVSTTGSDANGNGTSGAPFATVAKALAWVQPLRTMAGVSITISLAAGTYTSATSIDVSHISGGQLSIIGQTYTTPVTSVASSSGSSGAYSIVLNVASNANMAAGDWLAINGVSGGTNPEYLAGLFLVTGVSGGTQVTVTSYGLASTNPTAVPSGAAVGTVTVLKSILGFSNSASQGLYCSQIGTAIQLTGIMLLGASASLNSGLTLVSNSVYLTNVGISNFGNGLNTSNRSFISATSCYITHVATGINLYSGGYLTGALYVSGASGWGISVYQKAHFDNVGSYFVGNANALIFQVGSSMNSGALTVKGNGWGIYALRGCTVIFAGTTALTYCSTALGISGFTYAAVPAGITLGNNYTNYSPALNTLGNVQSYIDNT